jgi:hypothetical protein
VHEGAIELLKKRGILRPTHEQYRVSELLDLGTLSGQDVQ